jgi:hypothetical protein
LINVVANAVACKGLPLLFTYTKIIVNFWWIPHFVKTLFVEIPKGDKTMSGKSLCQKYLWHAGVIPMVNPKACWFERTD